MALIDGSRKHGTLTLEISFRFLFPTDIVFYIAFLQCENHRCLTGNKSF